MEKDTKMVHFTELQFSIFKKRYNQAVEVKEQDFTFNGNTYLTSYAKYVIEYLEQKFNKLNK